MSLQGKKNYKYLLSSLSLPLCAWVICAFPSPASSLSLDTSFILCMTLVIQVMDQAPSTKPELQLFKLCLLGWAGLGFWGQGGVFILQYAMWSVLVSTCMTARVATVPWSSLVEHPCEPLGCPSTECISFCLDQ